jgi:hypothetical protein
MTPLDFEGVRRDGGDTWTRADPTAALVEPVGEDGDTWSVFLPDGAAAHTVELHTDHGAYVGRCDCQGFQLTGLCAHLCTVRKAAFIGESDTTGERIRILELADEDDRADLHVERIVADGGRRYGGEWR